jgi:hypothetical protein
MIVSIVHLSLAIMGLHMMTDQKDKIGRIIGAACFVTNFAEHVAFVVGAP